MQDYSQNKIHQNTKINSISEKNRTDLSTLNEQEEMCKDKQFISFQVYEDKTENVSAKNKIFPKQQETILAPKSFTIFEDSTKPAILPYKMLEDRTETIPVMPSFKVLEDRTETMPVMPSFKIFEDGTETVPFIPSFKMAEDRTETMPVMPSFKVPGDRTATMPVMPSFKHFDDHTDPHISLFSKKKSDEVSLAEFGQPEMENSEFLNPMMQADTFLAPKLPALSSFQIFEDPADTQPMLQKNNSHTIPNKSSIFDPQNVADVEKSAHFGSPGVGISQQKPLIAESKLPSTPDTVDFFDLFSKTPEKPGKFQSNKSLFDFFMPKSPEPPQTPRKLTNHKKDYILYKPGMMETNESIGKSLRSATPMHNEDSGEFPRSYAPISKLVAVDKSMKELSLSFSDFHSDDKSGVDNNVSPKASLFVEKKAEHIIKNQACDFFKIPTTITPSSVVSIH
jgi:hypothetical protein